MAYQKVKDGVRYNEKYGRLIEHRGYSTRYFWSTQMLDYMRKNFATTLNQELADWLGIPKRTVIRKARELGLYKDKEWLKEIDRERARFALAAANKMGNPGCIQPGQHLSPATEFKKGNVPTEEVKRKQIESQKRYNRLHPDKVRARIEKATETRRMNFLNNKITASCLKR